MSITKSLFTTRLPSSPDTGSVVFASCEKHQAGRQGEGPWFETVLDGPTPLRRWANVLLHHARKLPVSRSGSEEGSHGR